MDMKSCHITVGMPRSIDPRRGRDDLKYSKAFQVGARI